MTSTGLERLSATHLDPDAVCVECGGQVLIRDWRGEGQPKWLQYEVYCTACLRVDGDGHPTQRDAMKSWLMRKEATNEAE